MDHHAQRGPRAHTGKVGPSWSEFIRSQAEAVIATDFFPVDSVLLGRFYVLIFVAVDTRIVHVAGITTNPTGVQTQAASRRAASIPAERR